MSQANLSELKQITTKETFAPVIKKFDRNEIVPHYYYKCWSLHLIDRSSLRKYDNHFKFIFTIFDSYTKYACAIPPKDK